MEIGWTLGEEIDGGNRPINFNGKHVGLMIIKRGYPICVQLVYTNLIMKVPYLYSVTQGLEWLSENEQYILQLVRSAGRMY